MSRFHYISFLLPLILGCSENIEPNTSNIEGEVKTEKFKMVWHWEDDFSTEDQEKLKGWIREVSSFTRKTIGTYQFNVYYHFHQSTGNEPVPYGHTSRKTNHQAVHFYVNPKFSKEAFLADWTAQHEISHLSLPFLGKKNMWFSEGYATYLSRKIMIKQGYYTAHEFDSIYFHKITDDKNIALLSDLSIPEICEQLKKSHNYPSIYYAGSSYFYIADQLLKTKYNTTLGQVITIYQSTNRTTDQSLEEVLLSLDEIIKDDLFSSLMIDFRTKPFKGLMKLMVL